MKDKTIRDYIESRKLRETWYDQKLRKTPKNVETDHSNQDDYKVYPEDDGRDLPRNPYSKT